MLLTTMKEVCNKLIDKSVSQMTVSQIDAEMNQRVCARQPSVLRRFDELMEERP